MCVFLCVCGSDDRVDCGGFVRQWRKNHGRCGVCGDPWDVPEPRPHETRGRYGRGIIVRNYTQAQVTMINCCCFVTLWKLV